MRKNPQAKQQILEELDHAVETLQNIKAELLLGNEDGMITEEKEEDKTKVNKMHEDIDAKLRAFFKPYNTTFEAYMKNPCRGVYPPSGFLDAKPYTEQIKQYEENIATFQATAYLAKASLEAKQKAFEEQKTILYNRAAITGQQVNQHEMLEYEHALKGAEKDILNAEGMVSDYNTRLWTFVYTTKPFNQHQFKKEFQSLFQDKLAFKVQARKAEAAELSR